MSIMVREKNIYIFFSLPDILLFTFFSSLLIVVLQLLFPRCVRHPAEHKSLGWTESVFGSPYAEETLGSNKAYLSVRIGSDSSWPSAFHWASDTQPKSDRRFLWALWYTGRHDGSLTARPLGSSSGEATSSGVNHLRELPCLHFSLLPQIYIFVILEKTKGNSEERQSPFISNVERVGRL